MNIAALPTPYYQDDAVVIYHGDAHALAPLLEFDVVLTDPPYGVQINFGDESTDSQKWFVRHCQMLADIGRPTAFTVPATKLFDIPRPQWVGVWHKPMTFGFWSTPLIPHWEPIVFYGMPTKARRSDVWTCNPQKPNGHPTPKPEPLWRGILAAMPEGVVLDPFMGSGTTLRVAKDLGRRAIGIELEERYCEIAANRMAQTVLPLGELA